MSQCILITGCSSGIGAALAREFHQRGHTVYATARRLESLASLQQAGLRILALDVNDDASIAAAMDVVRREQGRLDVLVNNAGGTGGATTPYDFDTALAVNLGAVYHLTGALAEALGASALEGGAAVDRKSVV